MKVNGMNSKIVIINELQDKKESIGLLLEKAEKGTITLLYSSREDRYNNAIALKEYLEAKLKHNK